MAAMQKRKVQHPDKYFKPIIARALKKALSDVDGKQKYCHLLSQHRRWLEELEADQPGWLIPWLPRIDALIKALSRVEKEMRCERFTLSDEDAENDQYVDKQTKESLSFYMKLILDAKEYNPKLNRKDILRYKKETNRG
tara:strand:+ start:324 stop:740 length:417 start_codon:yes stop_codon:yes gene_type:complete